MIGQQVTWTDDFRPMPDNLMGDSDAAFDMSLIQTGRGEVLSVTRSLFGEWVALIQSECGIVERKVSDLTLVRAS